MRLTQEQVNRYFEDGFLLVENVFTDADLQPVVDEFDEMVEEYAQRLYDAGKIANTHADKAFDTRLAAIAKELPNAGVLIHVNEQVRPKLAELWSSDRLVDLVAQFIGPDIDGHPLCCVRSKTPETPLMTVPWHQDAAYHLRDDAIHTIQPTAWIPFVDVNETNGTLEVVCGGHKVGRVLRHRLEKRVGAKDSWYVYIDEDDLPPGERVVCEMKTGSVLFHNPLMPHRSTENHTDRVRWSVDLRWQRPGEPTGYADSKMIPMRRKDDPSYRLDWAHWQRQSMDDVDKARGRSGVDPFDTTVEGGWLERWA